MSEREHWQRVYESKPSDAVSWFQAEATLSLDLIRRIGAPREAAIIDVGGGASTLVDGLLAEGFGDLRLGQLQQVVRDLFYPEATLRQLAEIAVQVRDPAGLIRPAEFRDRLGIGRKRSIQILEHFDRIGLTRRIGNDRRLREGSALAEQLLGGVSP